MFTDYNFWIGAGFGAGVMSLYMMWATEYEVRKWRELTDKAIALADKLNKELKEIDDAQV